MKLEIKHIAPYLPYGLKIQGQTHGEIQEMTGLNSGGLMINHNTKGWADFFDIKPILRPLSDLSVLVIEEFEKYHGKRNGKANEEIINLFCEENGVDEILENIDLKSLPYECIEYMFRNHYDVFGLIEQGLAISIHDVKLKEIKT